MSMTIANAFFLSGALPEASLKSIICYSSHLLLLKPSKVSKSTVVTKSRAMEIFFLSFISFLS
jgi:hypothetical protein